MKRGLAAVRVVALLFIIVIAVPGCERNVTIIADPVDEHDHLRLNEDLLTDEELELVRCFRISLEVESDGEEPTEMGVACLEEQ